MRKFFCILILAIITITSLFAENTSSTFLDEMFNSDIPITYGDEAFRARILEKTKGERDPIGLVLTGGSARACAHIGVLKYLEEQGIVPDFIVSNSMGSIVGMLYAAGLMPEHIEEVLQTADLSALFSFTLPLKGGLLVPTGFRTMIESLVGEDFKLEDTDIPVMVVSEDLVTKREIRIAEGDFTDILIGSFALPVYFSPYEYQGHLLVDGGIISLAPLNAAYEYSDTVILSSTFYDQENIQLLNPVAVLNSSFDIIKRQNAAKDMKKWQDFVWIRCAVENYSFMDFNKALEMSDIGYESAKKMEDELSVLYKAGSVSPNMNVLRTDKPAKIEKIRKNLSYFDRIEASTPTLILSLGMKEMNFSKNSDYYLKNSMIIGLDYSFLLNSIEIGVGTGVGFDNSDLRDSTAFWSTSSYIGYYPLDNLRITGEVNADFGRKNAGFRPTLYAREGIDYIPMNIDGDFRFGVHQTMEYYKDYADPAMGAATLLSIGSKFDGNFNFGYISAYGGYMVTGTSIIWENARNFMQLKGLVRVYINDNDTWYVDGGIRTRFTLDGKGRVPLFFSDDYATGILDYGARQIYGTNAKYHNTIIGLEVGYDIPRSFTFGEFLILDNSELGLYCNMLWSDMRFGVSTGLDLQTNVSLIGLVSIPMRFKMGYEYTIEGTHAFVASLLFNLKY